MNGYLKLGAVAISLVLVFLYGEMRYNQADSKGKLELAHFRQELADEHIRELSRQQYEREQVELAFEQSRKNSEAELASVRSDLSRLLRSANNARDSKRNQTSGEFNGAGADWIGGFAACAEEYVELGEDFARTADKLRGLQEFTERILE